MASRSTLHSGTGGAVTGDNYMDNVKGHVETFYKAVFLRVTNVAGTANDPTGTIDPALDAGLIAGMAFWFEPISDITGTMTLKIGAEAAVAVVAADGVAVGAGDVLTGTAYLLFYDGTELRILSTAGVDQTGADLTYTVIASSGTLTKPTAFPDDGLVVIEAWGGGGGNRGGGGAYDTQVFRGADLGSTETVTVGTGGVGSVAGGNTSVGTLVLAFGGGHSTGGGGGQISAGSNSGGAGGDPFGGNQDGNAGGGQTGGSNPGGDGIFGGGGGSTGGRGGHSLYGSAGGGITGGTSVFGGNGGASGVGGSIPGGGGGASGATGARGEVRVRWIG